jgi:hypothetical protein
MKKYPKNFMDGLRMNHEAAKENSSGIFSNEEHELLSLKRQLYCKLLNLNDKQQERELDLLKVLSKDKQIQAYLNSKDFPKKD